MLEVLLNFFTPKAVSSMGRKHCSIYSPSHDNPSHDFAVSLLSAEELVEPAGSPLPMGKKTVSQKHSLTTLCVALHLVLIVVHIALLISAMKHWEHHFTFWLEHQTAVSFWTTVGTQSFGTIYCAILVFLTQKIAMRGKFGSDVTLTAIHDTISSWAGLGSALATLLNQVSIPASVFVSLNIVGYLGCISILHISIPAILSVDVFNMTVTMPASTFGVPEYANSTVINSTRNYMRTFPVNLLPWRGIFDDSQMIGLSNSSVYEILKTTTSGKGEAQVSALGFNVSCGYPSPKIDYVDLDVGEPTLVLTTNNVSTWFLAPSLVPNVLSAFADQLNDSIYIYTTTTVVDSQGHNGSPLIFSQQSPAFLNNLTHLNLNISQIQLLQCSKSSVAQSAVLDTQTNIITSSSLYPNIHKNHSTWVPAADLDFTPWSSTFLGNISWLDLGFPVETYSVLGAIDEYLMSYLDLDLHVNPSSGLQLHDIENALSNLLAMIFWTAGHVELNPWYIKYSLNVDNGVSEAETVPGLNSGNTTITQQETSHVRLSLNLIAVTLGFITSIVQMILCIMLLWTSTGHDNNIQGNGLLHYIWLWHSCLQFSHSLKEVKQPTEANLRNAGQIPQHPLTEEWDDRDAEWQQLKKHQDGRLLEDKSSSTVLQTIRGSIPLWPKSSTMCISLHLLLVVLYIIVPVLGMARKDHNIIFSIKNQQAVSFWCKFGTTAFGMIYCTVLVYLTQRLAITYAIQKYSLLTAIHDKTLAWTGIGSAALALYKQVKLPASPLGTLSVCLYVATISVLHITNPALVSVESFSLSIPTTVETQGTPQWSGTPNNSTLLALQMSGGFLPWIGTLDEAKKLGLSNASLYDVLEQAYPGSGHTEISAVGFNISCGYMPGVMVKEIPKTFAEQLYNISFPTASLHWPQWDNLPDPNTILIGNSAFALPTDSIILYTQNSVYDSDGGLGSPVPLPSSNVTLQFIQCSNSLVPQMGQVDAGSRLVIPNSLYPTIQKHNSTWQAYSTISSMKIQDEKSLLEGDYWTQIISNFDDANFLPDEPSGGWGIDWGSVNLMQQLGLNSVATLIDPETDTLPPLTPLQGLYLHDIENAISNLVASTFWIGAHVHQSSLMLENSEVVPPILSTGNTTVDQVVLAVRLDISLAAVRLKAVSIVLVWLIAGGFNQPWCINCLAHTNLLVFTGHKNF
ncbi:hypothetical protein K438DRAFT_1829199 [Mycena galopus ATCC 62051]|nr:hypothetical protein K438DRAFT_1829199 [Mycena galopus ATCC 62051]